jgi:DnaJ-class molecular chaperone
MGGFGGPGGAVDVQDISDIFDAFFGGAVGGPGGRGGVRGGGASRQRNANAPVAGLINIILTANMSAFYLLTTIFVSVFFDLQAMTCKLKLRFHL